MLSWRAPEHRPFVISTQATRVTQQRRRGTSTWVPLLVVSAVALAACDTDDGREMRPPTQPIPPTVVTTPATSEAMVDSMIDSMVDSMPADAGDVDSGDVEFSAGDLPAIDLALVAPWQNGDAIPALYTCDGDEVSPTLRWAAGPGATTEYVVTMVDPDAANFVHWIVMGIDPASTSLLQGSLPPGLTQAPNSAGRAAYMGPCPPAAETHNYLITVYALGQQLELAGDESPGELLAMFQAASLASSTVSGTYQRAS